MLTSATTLSNKMQWNIFTRARGKSKKIVAFSSWRSRNFYIDFQIEFSNIWKLRKQQWKFSERVFPLSCFACVSFVFVFFGRKITLEVVGNISVMCNYETLSIFEHSHEILLNVIWKFTFEYFLQISLHCFESTLN